MYLYSAMSKRIVSILRQACDHVETYSIDESFLDLKGYEKNYNLESYMRDVANRVGNIQIPMYVSALKQSR